MNILGTKLRMSTAFHPQTDGQVERMNAVVETTLRVFAQDETRTWDDSLPFVEFSINNTTSASTGYTPFYLNYGYHPSGFWDLLVDRTPSKVQTLEAWLQRLNDDLSKARTAVEYAQLRMKRQADGGRREERFCLGDRVLLSVAKRKLPLLHLPGFVGSNKLHPKFVGPYQVVECVSSLAYRLALPAHFRAHDVFHVDRLKRWIAPTRINRPPVLSSTEPITTAQTTFDVDRILDVRDLKRGHHSRREYLVVWTGYSLSDATWEPEVNLQCPRLLRAFWRNRRRTSA